MGIFEERNPEEPFEELLEEWEANARERRQESARRIATTTVSGEIDHTYASKPSRIQRIWHRLFSVEPADTPYEYAFPFSSYTGSVDSAGPLIETRKRMRQGGLRNLDADEPPAENT